MSGNCDEFVAMYTNEVLEGDLLWLPLLSPLVFAETVKVLEVCSPMPVAVAAGHHA